MRIISLFLYYPSSYFFLYLSFENYIFRDFIKIYNLLDDIGKHTVKSVAKTEYMRLRPDFLQNALIAAYGSITSSKPLTDDEKQILDLVEKIKKDKND